MLTHPQKPLALTLQPEFTFTTFKPVNNNETVAILKQCAQGNKDYAIVYCWGQAATGKSHLLQSVCNLASESQLSSYYLDVSKTVFTVDSLDGLEFFDLVCIDAIDQVIQQPDWQKALFNLINRIMAQQKVLVVASQKNVKEHQLKLADLASRLTWGINLKINPVEKDKLNDLLQFKAQQIGFELAKETANYLINYHSSDLKKLTGILKNINEQALSLKKQKITVSFIKKYCL